MKAEICVDTETSLASVKVSFSTPEEAGLAIDAVKNAAVMLWPGIEFEEEVRLPGGEADPAAPPAVDRRYIDFTKPPKADGFDGKVLAQFRDIGRVDVEAAMMAFNKERGIVSMTIARLRKGGHLEGLA